MRNKTIILLTFLVAVITSACVTISPPPGIPVDLSKADRKFTCKSEDQDTTPIGVEMYQFGTEQDSGGRIVFLITIRGTNKQFLTIWAFRSEWRTKEQRYIEQYIEKYTHYAKIDMGWQDVGDLEAKENMTDAERKEAEKNMEKMTDLFRAYLPKEYRHVSFRELWENAGCTTHGPVPFFW